MTVQCLKFGKNLICLNPFHLGSPYTYALLLLRCWMTNHLSQKAIQNNISDVGELRREDGQQPEIVAVKVLKETATREAEEDFMREVDIMSAFRHSNILSLIGVVLRGKTCLSVFVAWLVEPTSFFALGLGGTFLEHLYS